MNKEKMIYSTHHQGQVVVAALKHYGIKRVVISSGSRNAPLVISVTQDDYFECYSVIDERSAAFFAMGMAKEDGVPVAVMCTSGSAVLNYYPAVAEAYYSRVPLIVISADRPASMIDKGMGQTIRQGCVMEAHCSYSTALREGVEDVAYNVGECERAIGVAINSSSPVHINVPFAEPLYNTTSDAVDFSFSGDDDVCDEDVVIDDDVLDKWQKARRPMVICGAHHRDEKLEEILKVLYEKRGVITLCENISNLHSKCFIENIDRVIVPLTVDEEQELKPDFLISIGGMIVSKKIKSFLSSSTLTAHLYVNEYVWPDTYGQLSYSVKSCDTSFLTELLKVKKEKVDYADKWLNKNTRSLDSHIKYSSFAPYSDFYVWNVLSSYIPAYTHLEIANSSSIRYSQLFNFKAGVTYWCNRGTSGIDGSTSTAVGAAVVCDRPVTHITGDLSFFYDSNALWNNYIPSTMRIIVMNNGGGGIFRILDGSRKADCCADFLEARHSLSAVHIAKMYDIDYVKVDDEKTLREALDGFWKDSPRPRMIEVFTPRDDNDTILRDYFKFLIKDKE